MRFPVTEFCRRLMVKRIPFCQNLFAGKSEKIIGKRTKHFRNDFRWLRFYVDDENSASNCKVSFVCYGRHASTRNAAIGELGRKQFGHGIDTQILPQPKSSARGYPVGTSELLRNYTLCQT